MKMKMKTLFLITGIGILAVSIALFTTKSLDSPQSTVTNDSGSVTAKEDANISLDEMMTYAILDEYRAHSEYEAIIEKYGAQVPFSNIVEAEKKHISELKPLFSQYNLSLPADESKNQVVLPESLQAAYKTGVQAEIDNIAMYEKFLKQPHLPSDVKTVFTRLMNASKNHLRAFQNAANG